MGLKKKLLKIVPAVLGVMTSGAIGAGVADQIVLTISPELAQVITGILSAIITLVGFLSDKPQDELKK